MHQRNHHLIQTIVAQFSNNHKYMHYFHINLVLNYSQIDSTKRKPNSLDWILCRLDRGNRMFDSMHKYGILDIVLQHLHSSPDMLDFCNWMMFLVFPYKLDNQHQQHLELLNNHRCHFHHHCWYSNRNYCLDLIQMIRQHLIHQMMDFQCYQLNLF